MRNNNNKTPFSLLCLPSYYVKLGSQKWFAFKGFKSPCWRPCIHSILMRNHLVLHFTYYFGAEQAAITKLAQLDNSFITKILKPQFGSTTDTYQSNLFRLACKATKVRVQHFHYKIKTTPLLFLAISSCHPLPLL